MSGIPDVRIEHFRRQHPVGSDLSQPLDALPLRGGAGENDAHRGIRDVESFIDRLAGDQNADAACAIPRPLFANHRARHSSCHS